ncbi:MAG: Lpg1974 family pore-forming outer membrane protein [Gammaproteobacteria bacterium]|jgi:hypothetical protein
MKRIYKRLFMLSCISSALTTTAFAQQLATAPQLEGGVTFSIGTFYAGPGTDTEPYAVSIIETPITSAAKASAQTVSPTYYYPSTQYDWGVEASLGYVFEDTANGVELLYRGFDATSNNTAADNNGVSPPGFAVVSNEAFNELKDEFESADLMISQFLDIGEMMQMRFQAGLAYIALKHKNNTYFKNSEISEVMAHQSAESEYEGWGPRLGIDTRYGFDESLEGFGFVIGGSIAYFFGQLNSYSSFSNNILMENNYYIDDNTDSHSVLNLRATVGVDYVYFFDDEESTLGLEVGYLVDYYDEAINQISTSENQQSSATFDADLVAASFMGPYINLKGVF